MPKSIFDISKKFGLNAKEVLAKAKAIGIAQAKVVSSPLSEPDAERLEMELTKASANFAASSVPQKDGARNLEKCKMALPAQLQMKPNLSGRRIVKVQAGTAWEATLKHRIYSCPDTPEYDFALGATALILENRRTNVCIPLEVCSVKILAANELEILDNVVSPLHARLKQYLSEAKKFTGIIRPRHAHRFYFLSEDPWPPEMQKITASVSEIEWTAILSILADPDRFFQWPRVSELLWPGCVRTQNDGEHVFPEELVRRLVKMGLKPDTRTNGPAIVSFLASGGIRPNWGIEGWPIHHIYYGTNGSSSAVKDGNLFTHSAGLVAVHPVVHHILHESKANLLKWLLWREAYLRFKFDPMGVFKNSK